LSTIKQQLVSIIILTYNQLKYTKQCVESVEKHTPEPHEIIFVDNGSSDGTRDYLKRYAKKHKQVELILNDENKGFAGGNNQGIVQAKGNYIVLLNNDMVVTEHWLERLIAHAEISPDIGMVGPMSNSVSGPQLMQPVPYVDKDMQAMQKFARAFSSKNSGKRTLMLRLVGFCLLIKKEVIDVIGGLDENYISGNFEDDDLCLRSFIAGYKNIIAQDVFIHHYGSMTFKGNAINYQATMNDNRQYFADKWKDVIEISANGYKVHMTKEQQLKKLLEWGEERFSQGNIHSATKLFLRILQIDRTNSQALNNLGVIQWQHDDVVSAMETFQIALSFNPKDPDALANLLRAATETGKFDLLKPNLLDTLKQAQPANPDIARLINGHQANVCINSRN
jgi:GT2 family glycosyltransferase